MSTFGTRLKKIRINLGLSQKDMANVFETSVAYISLVETDKSKLSPENIVKLLLNYNVNLNWLSAGIGDMFISNCNNTLEMHNNEDLTKNLDTFKERFQKLVDANNLNSYSLSKKTNIRESRCEELYIGKKLPNFEELNAIKSHFDVSIDWLLYGETPNTTGENNSSTQNNEPTLSAAEIEFIRNLMKKSNS